MTPKTYLRPEDIELSARLFQRGCKIAVSGAVAINGPHELARKRRAQTITLAAPIEDLSSFLGPYPVEDPRAIDQRRVERHPRVDGARRPRIALVIDVDYWAFGNIARQLCRYLSDRFEFRVIPASVVSQLVQILILAEECDMIHFFWREELRAIGSPGFREYAGSLGFRYSDFEKRFLSAKVITTSVYDHLFLDVDELFERRGLYNTRISGYSVVSERLKSVYSGLDGYPAPSALTEDGVDLTLFKPARLERFRTIAERELVVGWAGNSAWAARREDFKGVRTILNPALEELAREGYRIKPLFADRRIGYIAHTEMPRYYSEVDLYICTSKVEGTPNPVLEAMACGVPIVSTDVGIVPQAFGELQKRFIMRERSKEALKDSIKQLVHNPSLFSRLSGENVESVKTWDWFIKAEKYADFFTEMYTRSRATKSPRIPRGDEGSRVDTDSLCTYSFRSRTSQQEGIMMGDNQESSGSIRSNLTHWQQLQNEDYFENHSVYQGLRDFDDSTTSLIERFVTLNRGMNVVVIGCGYGRDSAHIAPVVNHVYGIDVNERLLAKADTYMRSKGVSNFTPVLADRYKSQIPDGIDLVFSIVVMQHLTRDLVRDYFQSLGRKLSKSGAFCVQFVEDFMSQEQDASLRVYEPSISWSTRQIFELSQACDLTFLEARTFQVTPTALWHWAHFGAPTS